MSNKYFELDSAMNMIKEDIIRDLSESVNKQSKDIFLHKSSTKELSFYEELED